MRARNLLLCFLAYPLITHAAPGDTRLISVRDPDVVLASAMSSSNNAAVSADGRYVAFRTAAQDILPGIAGGIVLFDRNAGTYEAISVSSAGVRGNAESGRVAMSAGGRYVVFESRASNLVPNDTNDSMDVFVRDRQAGTTTRVSVSSSGTEATSSSGFADSADPAISADGRYVAFSSSADNLVPGTPPGTVQVYLHDRQTGTTALVSVDNAGLPGLGDSFEPDLNGDGRFVAFSSSAPNLVPLDTNNAQDVFVRDRQAGSTTRISVATSGEQAGGVEFLFSMGPSMSADGRYVVFDSSATNLDGTDANGDAQDIFVRDRQTNTTTRITNGNSSSFEPYVDSAGRFITFQSTASNLVPNDSNGWNDIFAYDRQTGAMSCASVSTQGNEASQASQQGRISGNGRYVVFTSTSSNLVANDRNVSEDVFVRDLQGSFTTLASRSRIRSSTGAGISEVDLAPAVSSNGRYVAFRSFSEVLVEDDSNEFTDIFVRDNSLGTTVRVSIGTDGSQANADSLESTISANGRFVAFRSSATNLVLGDELFTPDVFVYDRQTRGIERIRVNWPQPTSLSSNTAPTLSADGRFVAFAAGAEFVDGTTQQGIYVRDRQTNTDELVTVALDGTPADSGSMDAMISANGRYVAFASYANNLVPGDTNDALDIFVRDLQTDTTQRVSIGPDGTQGNDASAYPSISADGRYVLFTSAASNLVAGDTNEVRDVFVHDLQTHTTTRVSVATGGGQADEESMSGSLSADGRFAAYSSDATNLVPGDTNNISDIFVYDRVTGQTRRESVSSTGAQANRFGSIRPSLTGTGNAVVFRSDAANFVASDLNDTVDVFMRERSASNTLRINVGGGGFTDSLGQFWEADRGYNTGGVSTYSSPIANTDDDVMYQTERYDAAAAPELQYSLAVPNGSYFVVLHFAENYVPNFGVGKRVFDVDIEGAPAFDNIDVFAEAGARAALLKSTSATVADGQINILFRHQTQNPIVDAIEVIQQ